MTDALLLGLDHALFALAYVTGAAAPIAVIAASARLGGLPLYRAAHRRVTSYRLHRAARRSGRDTLTIPTVVLDAMRDRADHAEAVQRILNGSEPITTGR